MGDQGQDPRLLCSDGVLAKEAFELVLDRRPYSAQSWRHMGSWPCPTHVQGQDALASGHSQVRWEPQYLEARAALAWTPALGGVIECDTEQSTNSAQLSCWFWGVILSPTLKSTQLLYPAQFLQHC